MRLRHVAAFCAIAACGVVAACIPNLITDPAPDASIPPQIGQFCGDGYITLGQYDGGFSDLASGEQCDPGEAGAIGCSSDCRVECDGGIIDSVTNHCYFIAAPATALEVAEQNCELVNGHVATFVDDRERSYVLSALGKSLSIGDAAAFWGAFSVSPQEGAYVPPSPNNELEPGWLPACSGCYAAPNVGASIPRLLNDGGGQCVLDLAKFGWSQFPCAAIPVALPVVCEREPPGSLAIPCAGSTCVSVPPTAGKKRYFFSPQPRSAEQASDQCAELGGSLVVFDSPEERETLLREIARAAIALHPPEAWIGLSIPDGGAAWIWDDDAGVDGSPWGDNQPTAAASGSSRAYVVLGPESYDIQLAHNDTDMPRPFICQR